MSEYFIDLLPSSWNTNVGFVEEKGRDFFLSADFINSNLEDIKSAK